MTEQPGGPQWLTAEQLENWQAVVALLMTLPGALDAQLKREAGINTFEYHVLAGLADRPNGSMAMGELALLTQVSPSRLSHAVARLERSGWIERRSAAARCVNAFITEAGRRKLGETAPGHVREVRRLVVDALTAEQLDSLAQAARIVTERADPTLVSALERSRGDDGACDTAC
jgi:DNA-binding MarR family transcriptional regulator